MYRHGSCFALGTVRVSFDLLGNVPQHVDFLNLRLPPHHSAHHPVHPPCAFPTGRTLATGFMHVEMAEALDRLDDVGGLVDHDHGGSAEARLHLPERIEVHQHIVADVLGQAGDRGATRYHGLQVVPTAADTAGMLLDELPHGDTHLLLHVARLVHVAGDGKNL